MTLLVIGVIPITGVDIGGAPRLVDNRAITRQQLI
mgnify:CR=1 FL=1